MPFFGLFGNGPYMAWPKNFNLTKDQFRLLSNASYQVVASEHGLPMVQLDLNFRRLNGARKPVNSLRQMFSGMSVYRDYYPSVANPDMTLAVLMDRSGSMSETFNDGHVYNVCANVLNYVQSAGVGFDLMFYDDRVDFGGHITSESQLKQAINSHWARGGTYVTEALRQTVTRHHKKSGIYIIVVTDGEFSDKTSVQSYVMDELFPMITPENPFAVRLHFVGAGEHVDREFLEQLESLALGKGVQLVTSHHHAHLSHAHDSILDELDRSFMGIGPNFKIEELVGGEPMVTQIGNVVGRKWNAGNSATFKFLPRHCLVGMEFSNNHDPNLHVGCSVEAADRNDSPFQIDLNVPMPRLSTAQTGTKSWKDIMFWQNPEERASRAEFAQHVIDVHELELERQSQDLVELARGGIPVEAKKRLKELGKGADEANALFTSNLAPDEIALLRRHDIKVRGLVTGSAMYHVGQSYASKYNDCEVKVLSDAYDKATELAISRMEQELLYMNAHGAVGVRLNLVRHEWSDKTIEVQAIGTAIQAPGRMPLRPWLCDLSGQEWYALHRAGYEPVALVYGYCTWFVLTTTSDEYTMRRWQNVEMTHWSDALKQARNVAMHKVQNMCKAAGGVGITGVRVNRRLDETRLTGPGEDPAYEREHHNLVMSVIGTAIKVRGNAPRAVQQAQYVLSLRDGRLKPMVVKQGADLTIE